MNKAELIEALAQHYEGSKSEATKALNAVVQTITYTAAAGEKVAITGFGVFEKVDRPARMVRNPRTGERKEAAATSVPRFRPGTELKAYVAGERALPDGSAPVSAPVRRTPARTTTTTVAPVEPAPVAAAPVEVADEPVAKSAKKRAASTKAASAKAAPAKGASSKAASSKAASSKAASSKTAAKAPSKKDSKAAADKKDSKGKKKDGKKS